MPSIQLARNEYAVINTNRDFVYGSFRPLTQAVLTRTFVPPARAGGSDPDVRSAR